MPVIEDVSLGRVRLSVRRADGKRTDYGRLHVTVTGGTARAVRRQVEELSAEVASVEMPWRRRWEITTVDGDVWFAQGCGCGG